MIELRKVAKEYQIGQRITALDNLSLKIDDGEFVAIVGPSGCGKSTLLHIIGLLDRPDSGEYLLNGQSVEKLSSKQRAVARNQTFGFVFQSFNLLPRTSVFNNVSLPLQYRRASNQTEVVTQSLKQVGLLDRRSSWPNQLSGGQQQRVAVARAMVTDPKIILADEPTGNLDTKTGIEIMELFKNINKEGKTVILVTHNAELLHYASRIITMRDGKVEKDEKRKQ
jgi:putative ABC transport system ATP-binding protein